MPGKWTFLTNHSHVLICLAQDPDSRLADIASRVGITERATLAIVRDLVEEGYVARTRVGRRNQYRVNGNLWSRRGRPSSAPGRPDHLEGSNDSAAPMR
jgi:predicted ArsR family transcriptional regulator